MRLRQFHLGRFDRAAILRTAAPACGALGRVLRCADGPQGVARVEGEAGAGVQEQDARGLVQDHGRHRHLLRTGSHHGGSPKPSAHGRATSLRRAPWCDPARPRPALLPHAVHHPRAGGGGDWRAGEGVETVTSFRGARRANPESGDGDIEIRVRADARPGMTGYAACSTLSTPRRIWSSSIDSNSALKLPSPKPSSPLRWMNSKKIGPIAFAENICRSTLVWPPSTTPSPSIRMPFRFSRATSSPCLGSRISIFSKYVSGGDGMNGRPAVRRPSMVRWMSRQPQAMCWMPSPRSVFRYSSIWQDSPAPSLIGIRML